MLRKAILEAGFSRADIYECFGKNAPSKTTERLQFVCVKDS
jgi:hypothetical protein